MSGGADAVLDHASLIETDPYGGLVGLNVEAQLQELEDKVPDPSDTLFAMHDAWTNVKDHDVSMSIAETTLAAQLDLGSTIAILVDASTFEIGHDMAIPGAGVAGAELIVTISDKDGDDVTFAPPTSTTVLIGGAIYHDDTRAFSIILNDINFLQIYGIGYCVTSSPLISGMDRKCVAGTSIHQPFRLVPRQLTGDVLTIANQRQELINFSIQHVRGIPTSGHSLVIGSPTSGIISLFNSTNLSIWNPWIGILAGRGWGWNLKDFTYIQNPRKYGIEINSPIPYGGHVWGEIEMLDGIGASDAGIHIVANDWTEFHGNIKMTGFKTPILIDASVADVTNQKFNTVYMDNIVGSETAIILDHTGSPGRIKGTSFVQISGFLGGGVSRRGMFIGDGVKNTYIGNQDWHGGSWDLFTDGGIGTTVTHFNGKGDGGTNTGAGIHLLATSQDCTVQGGFSTGNTYGLEIDAGAVRFNIAQLNCSGNSTAALNAPSDVRASGKISNCEGILDHLTSTSATPDFDGQEAYVGGVWYKAAGASWDAMT